MPRGARELSETGFYHVVLRGNNRNFIFQDEQDHQVMISYLSKMRNRTNVDIICWCLMGNHLHLLIEDGNNELPIAMKFISESYAKFFNKKYSHSGHVFQGRYSSFPILNESYFLSAVRYIHNNPEKAGICGADKYQWSSFDEYLHGARICKTQILLETIGGPSSFEEFSKIDDCDFPLQLRGEISYSREEIKGFGLATLKEAGLKVSLESIGALPALEKKEAIAALFNRGMTVKQIEEATGIRKHTIYRIRK